MRTIYLLLVTLILGLFQTTTAGYINIKGVDKQVDTLEYRVIGPGIEYIRLRLPDYPMAVYLLKADMNNPNNFVETFQAQEQAGKTEAMSTAYNRLDGSMHRTIAGVNANFWIVSGQGQPNELLGVPHSGSMRNGEIITDPNGWNRGRGATEEEHLQDIGFAMVDNAKKICIDDINFQGKVRIPDGTEYAVAEINRIRKTDELVLFNRYLGKNIPTRSNDNGTEVFVKPLLDKWEVNKDVECVVTRIIKDKGANLLEEGEYVLSGSGAAQAFLDNLSVGAKVVLHLGIVTRKDNNLIMAEQMVTGNALVMKNGILTPRNYNEDYNTQLYPRTGIGTSGDGKTLYLITIDKKAGSTGAATETMCEILKAYGASDATSMDGGGSAQMMIEGTIVNNPADGKERPVANGWFLYHNAPDDNEIKSLMFEDFKIELPSYASYKPVVYGYNQYGVLVNKNIQGYTLTCSPEIGSITEENTFVASGTEGEGTLTVEYNGIRETKQIRVISGNIYLRLDSVLMDNRSNYPIELLSSTALGQILPVDPSSLTWTVTDEDICIVEEGEVKALKNGTTEVSAALEDKILSFKVRVEIPEYSPVIADPVNSSEWKLTASSFLKAQLNENNRPAGWGHGSVVNFTQTIGRAPSIKLEKDIYFFGLPDTIKVVLNIGDLQIERALLYMCANNGIDNVSKEFKQFQQNKDFTLDIPVADLYDTADRGIYPVSFSQIQFYLSSDMPEGTPYALAIKELDAYYKDIDSRSGLSFIDSDIVNVYPNPLTGDKLYLKSENFATRNTEIFIYNLSGQAVYAGQHRADNEGIIELPVNALAKGTYLLHLYYEGQMKSVKIIR